MNKLAIILGLIIIIGLFGLPVISSKATTQSIMQIIRSYGYPAENYTAETEDGWYLSLIRIPHGINSTTSTKGVFFFQHGLTDCAVGSVLNAPYESLPFIMADRGYDVWLGNNRGNGVSMHYKYATPDEEQFWEFSWDQMALYDVPTQVDFVLKFTNKSKLTYCGHSEGTTQAFAALVTLPSLADKLNLYIALAPVAYVHNCESPVIQALAALPDDVIYTILGKGEFALSDAISKILPGICKTLPQFCTYDVDLVCGPTEYWNTTRVPYYLQYEPNPTSIQNMIHWAQGVRQKKFQRYDYGSASLNMQHYNSTTPPPYDLSKFPTNLPTALFTGGKDYLADPKDVAILLSQLPLPPFVHDQPLYGHLDPLLGYRAYQQIYPIIVNLVEKYSTNY